MNWLNKLEWKYRRFGIERLMLYVTATMLAVFLADIVTGDRLSVYGLLYFNRTLILQGEIWRIFTFIFLPPSYNVLWLLLGLLCFHYIGQSLENTWGAFKFTVYYVCGLLFAIVSGFITGYNTNVYLNLSLFLAFAQIFPDAQFRLYLIIPVKAKYIAFVDWLLFAIAFFTALAQRDLATMSSVVFAVLNFMLFFGGDLWRDFQDRRKYGPQRRDFKSNRNDNPWGF